MRVYASLLARPQLPWMLAGACLGRLPYAMETIGTVVFVESTVGSYAVAGAAAGALAAGIAIGSVVLARLADRAGSGTLVPLSALHVLLMLALVSGGTSGWEAAPLVAVAFAVGCSVTPTSAVFRGRYPDVLMDTASGLRAAFALDSALTDATYIAGPGLVSVGVLIASPSAALLFAAATGLASALVLARTPGGSVAGRETRRVSALRSPAIRTLTLATLPLGAAFGVCEVAFPAFGSSQGNVALGGLLLSLMALASCMAALRYGADPGRDPAAAFLRHSLWLGLVFAIPAAGNSAVLVGLLSIPLGLVAGPWGVSRNQLTGVLALPGTASEAYGWHVTALLVGTGIGTAVAGPIVEHAGWREALGVAGLIAATIGLVALWGRARLRMPVELVGERLP